MSVLEGQAAIVTGAAMGLGMGYAPAMAERGGDLVIADVHPDVEEVARRLSGHEGRVIAVNSNVSRADDARRLVEAAVEAFGRIDILINNAGICRRTPPTDTLEESLDNYEALIGTNLRGPFMLGRAVIPHMIAQGAGNIVNIAT